MPAQRFLIGGWRLCLLALLTSALSFGFNGQCNLTEDSGSGSSPIQVIKANSPNIIKGHESGPDSELEVPAEAVDRDTEVAFMPFRHKQDLPGPLPDGCEFLGGANLAPRHKDKVDFHNGKEAECYVVLPDNVRAEELSNSDIRLMEFIDDRWVIVLPDKKGKVHTDGPKSGYIGPDDEKPAKLTGIRSFCWAIINDPAVIQSLYNLWLAISADSVIGGANPIMPTPPVSNINATATMPVITPPTTPVNYGPAWIKMNPANAPSDRYGVAMAYDLIRQKTVIFGGTITGYDSIKETWEYDGLNWTQMKPANSPSSRGFSAVAYDPVSRKTVLFGGGYYGSVYFNDTWEWDGLNWTVKSTANKPSARVWPVMVYDSARQKMVLFGGFYEGNYRNDTWEWDGDNWTKINPAASPPGRHYHAMAYDSARQRTVLFGGWTAWDTTTNETWEWDGINWMFKSPVNKPTARAAPSMAYDPVRQKTILFGGSSNDDTWEWDGINWMQVIPNISPSKRSQHKMIYDSIRQRIILFGGATPTGASNETWEFVILK